MEPGHPPLDTDLISASGRWSAAQIPASCRRHRSGWLLGLLLCCPLLPVLGGEPPQRQQLVIETASGERHRFQVEVARSLRERKRGLSGRRELPADAGMLFDFEREQPVTMWMVGTWLSLDMLFIRADGMISRIERQAEPLSARRIRSGGPVRAVLEINGGKARALGIRPGDRVLYSWVTEGSNPGPFHASIAMMEAGAGPADCRAGAFR